VTAPLLLLPISHVLRRNRFDNSEPKATTLLIAVEDNSTVMNAGAEALLGSGGGRYGGRSGRCVTVSSYLEAVGVLACHKAGVNLACLTPDVPSIRQMAPMTSLHATTEGTAAGGDGGSGGARGEEDSSSGSAPPSQELLALVDA